MFTNLNSINSGVHMGGGRVQRVAPREGGREVRPDRGQLDERSGDGGAEVHARCRCSQGAAVRGGRVRWKHR